MSILSSVANKIQFSSMLDNLDQHYTWSSKFILWSTYNVGRFWWNPDPKWYYLTMWPQTSLFLFIYMVPRILRACFLCHLRVLTNKHLEFVSQVRLFRKDFAWRKQIKLLGVNFPLLSVWCNVDNFYRLMVLVL